MSRTPSAAALEKLDRAVKYYEAAALLAAASQADNHPGDVVHDFLQCLQGDATANCCAADDEKSKRLCEEAAAHVREALQGLTTMVGKEQAQKIVAKSYPRASLLRRLMRDRRRLIATLLATGIFLVWFHKPRKVESSLIVQRHWVAGADIADDHELRSLLTERGYQTLNEARREVYRLQTPREQFAELLAWARAQELSPRAVFQWIKGSFTKPGRESLAKLLLMQWLETTPTGVPYALLANPIALVKKPGLFQQDVQ